MNILHDSDLGEGEPPETVDDYVYLLSRHIIDVLPDDCGLGDEALDACIAKWELMAKPLLAELFGKIERLQADASYQCAAQWRDKCHAAEAECKCLRDLLSKAHAYVCLVDCPDDGGGDVKHGELCVRIREEVEK